MIEQLQLKKGDAVGIVSTARKIDRTEIQPAIERIESWGYKPRLGKTIGASEHQFAGSDALRAADLQHMLEDPEVKAVFFARGGYGTVRILQLLDPRPLRRSPKWLIGFSDLTALHAWVDHYIGQPCLHGPMPLTFANSTAESLNVLKNVLQGRLDAVQSPSHALNRKGKAHGRLVGGNLSVLYSINGCEFDWNYNGAILFIEDLDEYLYHIDRMMMNLLYSGKLDRLKGLIVGGMTQMNDNDIPFGETAEQIIRRYADRFKFPVCFGFPAGHISNNIPIALGMRVELEVSDQGARLSY